MYRGISSGNGSFVSAKIGGVNIRNRRSLSLIYRAFPAGRAVRSYAFKALGAGQVSTPIANANSDPDRHALHLR